MTYHSLVKEIFNCCCFYFLRNFFYQNVFKVKSFLSIMSEEQNTASHHKISKKNISLTKKVRDNPWVISTFVLGILVLIMLVSSFSPSVTGKIVSQEVASENVLNFLNSQTGGGVEFVSSEPVKDSKLYEIIVSYNGQEIPVYVTNDGEYYVQSISKLNGDFDSSANTGSSQSDSQNIPKSDVPVVELFVMGHCPYGTQAEKGFLPVMNLLGGKIDSSIRFVYYAMHPSYGEVEEQLNQYCIQKEQEDKFNGYLECFLEEGDGEGCLEKMQIDISKLDSCYDSADKEFSVISNLDDESSWLNGRYPLFNVDKDLNEQYGVAGSPTLVINGVQVSSGRSPAAYLEVICSSFSEGNVPEECGTDLPSDSYSPGFGWTLSTGVSTEGAQCY
jgi:hypothetical protein